MHIMQTGQAQCKHCAVSKARCVNTSATADGWQLTVWSIVKPCACHVVLQVAIEQLQSELTASRKEEAAIREEAQRVRAAA